MVYRLSILLVIIFFFAIAAKSQSSKKEMLHSDKKTNDTLIAPIVELKSLFENDTLIDRLLAMREIQSVRSEMNSSLKKLKSLELITKLNNTLKKTDKLKNIYKSTVVNLSYFKTNTPDSIINSNDFLNANVSFNVNMLNIPLSVQTSAVIEDGKLRTDFSYTNVRFDWEQYQDKTKQKLSANALKEYFKVDQLTQQLKINKLDSTALLNDVKFTLYNSIINHPKVIQLKYQVAHELDSLTNTIDSTQKAKSQKCIDSLNIVKERLQKFEKQYEMLWEKRKEMFAKIEDLKLRLTNAEQEINNLSDINYLKKKALSYKKYKRIDLKDKLMLNTKGLDLGQIGVDEQEFTIKNQLLNGVKYEYESGRNSWGFIVGNSRLRSLNTPVLFNPFQKTILGRQFLYFKYGYVTADSSEVQFRILNVHKTSDSLFRGQLTPGYNTVLSVGHDKKLSKTWSILTDVAYSNLRENWLEHTQKAQRFHDDIAASSSLFWLHKEVLKLGLGYFYVGNHFVTYGNDFLLNNRNGLKFDAQGVFFQKKISLKASVKTGFLNDASIVGLSQSSVTQMSGEINWQMTKNGSVQFQYTPNTITQIIRSADGIRGYDYKTNIYVLSGVFNYSIQKKRQSTYIILSNLNQQVDFFDSLRFNQSMFANIRHESFISNKSSIVVSSNIGFKEDFNTIQTGLIQTDLRTPIGKNTRVIIGLQAVKKTTDISWRGGLVSNLSFTFNKVFNIRCGIIYRQKPRGNTLARNNQNDQNNQNEWIGNTSMTMQF